ncbi:AAA domain-containing protein [Entomoplasma freundtii]|uniref:Uncharacterized protein n=1 Tax=Entomoplasma freundtii TaxID=74700 RepID=A0A2K8NSK4_9MOLU|nr:AAA domain-containing protein [Entomoplasma freundtii]ATZ16536.1 hypothetical protein EFREU_v1c05150 [Entomoplasma freundtii]TDY58298.1 AAA domain-containing protein [Entomoplasma freundtii]
MISHFEPTTKYKKYQKLLNNLLNIYPHDSALFTHLNQTTNFDLLPKLGEDNVRKLLESKDFKISLRETNWEELTKIIKKAPNGEVIIEAFKTKKERLAKTKKMALLNVKQFDITRNILLDELNNKIAQSKNKWMVYRRKAMDANIQDNVWQLHIATFFVSVKTPLKTLYAPLLLRETKIIFEDQHPFLVPLGSWKINEKLIFILNESGFKINENLVFSEDQTAFEVQTELLKILPLDPTSVNSWFGNFVGLEPIEIQTDNLIAHSGVVLGMFKPAGGHLRRTMLEIIENDELENILSPATNKRIYQNHVEDFILNQSDKLLRVQNSNFSQDKALISALIQDTIIWGPPGTGKSQVIANIIANILFYDKTAVVMSQKKAALDVLKKRLQNLSPFVLFILNDNKLSKEEFYKPLKEFISLVEYSQTVPLKRKRKIISATELQALESIRVCKETATFLPSMELVKAFGYQPKTLFDFFSLDKNYIYPRVGDSADFKNYQKVLSNSNHLDKEKNNFSFRKYPKNFKLQAQKSFTLMSNNPHLDVNSLLSFAQQTTYERTLALSQSSQAFSRNYSQDLDSDYLVGYLANRLLAKIENWKIHDVDKYEAYTRFANAVRASRRLPYKFVNEHKVILHDLFPIVITTPETSFISWQKEFFDYVILDESSQIFAETGLPLLYLAKTKILAGDTQQMQPSNWFATRDQGDANETDIPENTVSILNYAFDKGVYQVMLDQNFRSSAAALMSFSARHFYNSNLETIDKNVMKEVKNQKRILVKNVNGKWENGINQKEVNEVLKILKQEKKKYATILVLAFNVLQKQLLEKTIYENYPDLLDLVENEKIIIRNIENVQGDEADLVIMSVVYDDKTNISSTYVARPGGKNALNVAISRAREQMIVVKSIAANKIKFATNQDTTIFKKWLEFLDLQESQQKTYSSWEGYEFAPKQNATPTISRFKKEVFEVLNNQLLANKYITIKTQYPVGSKNLDLAIIDVFNTFKLGIQVDDFHYQGNENINHYLSSLSDQEFLEFKGYPIYKIKEIDWLLNRDQIIQDVNKLLS